MNETAPERSTRCLANFWTMKRARRAFSEGLRIYLVTMAEYGAR